MSPTKPQAHLVHLRSALLALGLLAVLAASVEYVLKHRELDRRHGLLVMPLPSKNQGTALQRECFSAPDMLPVYGSSELTVRMPNRCDVFFRPAPDGFAVCPVGGAGNTPIVSAEKLAALGAAIRGRKIAFIVSSTWFFHPGIEADNYAGNFSELQAISLLLSHDLDEGLRARFRERMMEFPSSFADRPILGCYLRGGAFTSAMLRPLLQVRGRMLEWEDHLATASDEFTESPPDIPVSGRPDDIDRLLGTRAAAPVENGEPSSPEDADEFMKRTNASTEWPDFALLLDLLKSQHVNAYFVCVPLPGKLFEKKRADRKTRGLFYRKLADECHARGFPISTLQAHDLDEDFMLPGTSHPTERGWLFIDRLIDAFYHDKLFPDMIQ